MIVAKPFIVAMAIQLIFALTLTVWPLHLAPAAAYEFHDDSAVSLIIDTDMGLDDARAILAILSDTLVTIHAFIVTEGSASIGKGADNLIGLLESTHNEHIPVYMGNTKQELEPPSWRRTAETMGGVPFPPPRTVRALAGSLGAVCELIASHHGTITYLMLGPSSTLAWLVRECPDGLGALGEILMPATVTPEGTVSDWNLRYDSTSTGVVIREAPNLVFIDISGVREIDAGAVFSALSETSLAARWIQNSMPNGTHRFLYDEPAAVAAIRPVMRTSRKRLYAVQTRRDGTLDMEPSERGTVTIAEFDDIRQSIELLVILWEHPHWEGTTAKSHEIIPPDTYLRAFHGHLGPYVVLGYRMGRHAIEITNSAGHFDLSVTIYSVLVPPRSCLIDGVQLGSGCTLGKRNIEIREFSGIPYSVFQTETGETVTIQFRPEISGFITSLIERVGVEAAGERLLELDIERLFIVEESRSE